MSAKICIICKKQKEITEYYKHSMMSDGHLNKCKSCCKEQSKKRTELKSQDPSWVEKERLRSVEKYHRLNYKLRKTKSNYDKKTVTVCKNLRRWYKINVCDIPKNIELHHWSYDHKNLKDVILMTRSNHKKLHAKIKYDETKKCFIVKETKDYLDTKEKHINYAKKFNLI
jgi:hypothetical protein